MICCNITNKTGSSYNGILLSFSDTYTSNLYFLCMWYIRAREKLWVKRDRLPRSDLKPGDSKILFEPLVVIKKIIIPPQYMKLGLMKHYINVLPTESDNFNYVILAFPGESIEKNQYIYIYIYIYMCARGCVCVIKKRDLTLNNAYAFICH